MSRPETMKEAMAVLEIVASYSDIVSAYVQELEAERDRLKAEYESYQKALNSALQILTCEKIPNDVIDAYKTDPMTNRMVEYLRTAFEQIRDSEMDRLKELLDDVATSGCEDVKGLRYLTVQIYRDVWAKIQDELEKVWSAPEGKGGTS